MKIRKEYLQRAEQDNVLPPGGAKALWENLSQQMAEEPAFKAQHLLYYIGALLMLLPLTLFVSAGFLSLGHAGLLVLSGAIGTCAFYMAELLLSKGRRIAAGTFSVVSLSLVPLAAYSLLSLCGVDLSTEYSSSYESFHDTVSSKFIIIELITLLASVGYFYRQRLPFLVLPVAVVLWYLGMDVSSRIIADGYASNYREWSITYGLLMLGIAYVVDRRTQHTLSDYSFWLWIFGTITFWGGLSAMDSGSELGKFGYALINLGLIVASVVLNRRVLVVFGALGLLGYLGHLCLSVFKDMAAFPLITLVLGAGVIWLGLQWPRIKTGIVNTLGVPTPE